MESSFFSPRSRPLAYRLRCHFSSCWIAYIVESTRFVKFTGFGLTTPEWEIIADIHDSKGVDAEVVASLIARAVNGYEKAHDMIEQMAAALDLCLDCGDCLTWEAEHDAQAILRRAWETGLCG